MTGSEKREKTLYDASLAGIFFWSGFTMFIILLMACITISFIVLVYRRSDPEGIKIILFCLALVVPCSYGIPLFSLIRVRMLERKLGVYWKDRTDQNRPEWERDWYLTCDRGGFILCHRNYIRDIHGYRIEEEIAEHARGKVCHVLYEDMDGKKRELKFSSASLAAEFQKWFQKQAYKEQDKNE